MDPEILQTMKTRDLLRETARETDENTDWAAYRKSRNLCTKLLRDKKCKLKKKKKLCPFKR